MSDIGRKCVHQHELAGQHGSYDFHSASALCARDGTRLFSPVSVSERTAVSGWIESHSKAISTYENWHVEFKRRHGSYHYFSYETITGKNFLSPMTCNFVNDLRLFVHRDQKIIDVNIHTEKQKL